MNKKLIAVAIGAALSGSAFAQSSNVTLYGRINTAIEANKIGGDAQGLNGGETAMRSYSSRLGVRGVEDLGGGLKGVFGIESALASDTGANGLGGGLRNAYVGLDTGSTGRVVMGRLDAAVNAPLYTQVFSVIDPIGYDTGAGSLANADDARNLSGLGNNVNATGAAVGTNTLQVIQRKSNSVGYDVKAMGVDVSARFTLGSPNNGVAAPNNATAAINSTSATAVGENDTRSFELAANYKMGALTLGAGYEKAFLSTAARAATFNGNGTGLTAEAGTAFDNRVQLVAGYDLGFAKIGGLYARNKIDAAALPNDDRSGSEFALSATVPLTMLSPKASFVANYAERDLIGIARPAAGAVGPTNFDGKRSQYAYGARYDFSKRTQVYALVNYTDASDKTNGNEARSFIAGVRHNF